MSIPLGTRLGFYEIVELAGTGGMGEVYRARDVRFGREVAIKILPSSKAADQDLLRRFEQEARSASSLNHPNIISIHDFGSWESSPYIVMEFLEGQTLKQLVATGRLNFRKILDLAVQISEGLAKAHSAGIVHRDLKMANIIVSKEGNAKIVDFGLAKLMIPPSDQLSGMQTREREITQTGIIVGTVPYMSPEQAAGQAVDYCSDQFSFGIILYELVAGKHPFLHPILSETLTAIIHNQPDFNLLNGAPAPYRWIVERCLEKDSEDRYASTLDLARDLGSLRDHLPEISRAAVSSKNVGIGSRQKFLLLLLVPALIALAYFAGSRRDSPISQQSAMQNLPSPVFHRLSFQRGTVWSARFAPDGETIVYSAAWEGNPLEIFTTHSGSPESRPLGMTSADLLDVSRSGEMAISLNRRVLLGNERIGTLARVPFSGGAPREISEDVAEADWNSAGDNLAIARVVGDGYWLENPIGNVLYKTNGWISHLRISPKGDFVAFINHRLRGDDRGSIAIVDAHKKLKILTEEWFSVQGLAWSPTGNEIWFTGSKDASGSILHAVSLTGNHRLVARAPGRLYLHDIFPDGRLLVSREDLRDVILALGPDQTKEQDLSWFDGSIVSGISNDGRKIVFFEGWEGGGPNQGVYIRGTDGSPAVRLGDGRQPSLSTDENWVACVLEDSKSQLVLIPTAAGQMRMLPRGSMETIQQPSWFPDGKRILFVGTEPRKGTRLYVQDIESGIQESITPEGIVPGLNHPISPDGKFIFFRHAGGSFSTYSLENGTVTSFPEIEHNWLPIRWSSDGRSIFLYSIRNLTIDICRFDIAHRQKKPWKVITPSDKVGVLGVEGFQITPDGKYYAYHALRQLSDLYLVDPLN